MRKFTFSVVLLAVCVVFFPGPGRAQVQARFTYDALINCDKPSVRNYPIHGEGTGKLSTDRNATLEHQSNVGGRDTYNVKLGAPPSAADGGSASLRVLGRRSLRAIREFPNNLVIVDLRVKRHVVQHDDSEPAEARPEAVYVPYISRHGLLQQAAGHQDIM